MLIALLRDKWSIICDGEQMTNTNQFNIGKQQGSRKVNDRYEAGTAEGEEAKDRKQNSSNLKSSQKIRLETIVKHCWHALSSIFSKQENGTWAAKGTRVWWILWAPPAKEHRCSHVYSRAGSAQPWNQDRIWVLYSKVEVVSKIRNIENS